MGKQFWGFLAVGLAVVAAAVGILWTSSKSAHLQLTGSILKVRVLSLSPAASLVVADFRVKNPSDVPFVVSDVQLKLDPASGASKDGEEVARADMENVFKYEKLIGPKFNDVLTLQDVIPPHQTMDRMAGARFEVPESVVNARKGVRLDLQDVDGTAAEIAEKP
ncbi:MAG TPA: hypothetical protein VFW83_03800 [Bryobacteraceae bacterium]|nr:hypothetical protein [Bryobacteraceae bacterium]